jgi:hypothetical protein
LFKKGCFIIQDFYLGFRIPIHHIYNISIPVLISGISEQTTEIEQEIKKIGKTFQFYAKMTKNCK